MMGARRSTLALLLTLTPHATTLQLAVPAVSRATLQSRGSGGAGPSRLRVAAIHAAASSSSSTTASASVATGVAGCGKWELDFYSRPVQGADGKKLWELLVTDGAGSFYHAEAVPSNCVNSRELRKRVQRLIDEAEVKPASIRFFRTQMKNMISIALAELSDVRCQPSRVTYRLYDWMDTREREVYPEMAGYRKPRPEMPPIKLPIKLPDQLRGEQYAFVTLPYAEFLPGGGITSENVGFGSLCPLPSNAAANIAVDAMVPGVVIFSQRSGAIAAWLGGTDLAFVKAILEARELHLEVGLDTQYLLARIRTAEQSLEAELFEEGKARTAGLHFISVQTNAEAESPDGFWLLKDYESQRQ